VYVKRQRLTTIYADAQEKYSIAATRIHALFGSVVRPADDLDSRASLDRVVKTGRANPDEFWSKLDQNPLAAEVFNDAMTEKARSQVPAVLASYDFSPFASIADVGEGRGHLAEALLNHLISA